MALNLVTITHPKLPGQSARVPRQSVPLHQMAGWVLAEADPPPDPPTAQPTEAPASAGASASPEKSPRDRRSSPKEGN